jgi:hypothetical protein
LVASPSRPTLAGVVDEDRGDLGKNATVNATGRFCYNLFGEDIDFMFAKSWCRKASKCKGLIFAFLALAAESEAQN